MGNHLIWFVDYHQIIMKHTLQGIKARLLVQILTLFINGGQISKIDTKKEKNIDQDLARTACQRELLKF